MLKLFHFLNIFQSKFRKKPSHYQTVRNSSILFFIFVSFNNLLDLSDTESTLWKNNSLIFFVSKYFYDSSLAKNVLLNGVLSLSFPCDINSDTSDKHENNFCAKKC